MLKLLAVVTVAMISFQSFSAHAWTHEFRTGETVVVVVSEGRTTGTVQRIDSDGYIIVSTPQGYSNYTGPVSNVLWILPELNGFRPQQTVVVVVPEGRTTGTVQRIDSDGTVFVSTPQGYSNYNGPITSILRIENSGYNGRDQFQVNETVVVHVHEGRTTGTLERIDSDGTVFVSTPQGYSNYNGPITRLLKVLNELNGFMVGDTVVVVVREGRTTGTIQSIDSDGTVIVTTPSGFSNYEGPISALIRSR